LEIEAQRRGQSLLLSRRQHLDHRRKVEVMRVKQRQTGEKIRASLYVGVAGTPVEDHSEGFKRGLNIPIAGGHNVVGFGRENVGEGSGGIGGHNSNLSQDGCFDSATTESRSQRQQQD
jgi:hypothetical protein